MAPTMRPTMRLATKPWVVMPVIAVAVLSVWWFVRGDSNNTATNNATSSTEQVVEASLANVSQTVSGEGTLAYEQTEELAFSAAGTVTAVHVTAGQAVTTGTVLAELDSPELEAAVSEAETAVAEAEATLSDDEDSGASETRIAADASALDMARDRLTEAQEDLAGTQLVASFDATVATVDLTVGEELAGSGTGATTMTGTGSGSGQSGPTVGSGSSAQPGTSSQADTSSASSVQIMLVSAGRFTVELGLDDSDVTKVKAGQSAAVSLSSSSSNNTFPGRGGFPGGGGFPGMGGTNSTENDNTQEAETTAPAITGVDAATGEVTELSTIADASSGVASYPVTVSFTDDSGDFQAGASVLVEITYAEKTDAVMVPVLAVSNSNGTSTVTVDNDSKRETRTVTTGLTSGRMIEIESGLEEGESVVVTTPGGFGAGAGQGPMGQVGGANETTENDG